MPPHRHRSSPFGGGFGLDGIIGLRRFSVPLRFAPPFRHLINAVFRRESFV